MPYKDPEKKREAGRKSSLKYYYKNREAKMAYNRKYEQRVKDEVFNHYGGYICACCGITHKVFLTIDHIHGGGSKHRKETGGGGKFNYRWIRKNNYPEGFQVLCWNCNCGRARNNDICPHKE